MIVPWAKQVNDPHTLQPMEHHGSSVALEKYPNHGWCIVIGGFVEARLDRPDVKFWRANPGLWEACRNQLSCFTLVE